MLSRGMLKTRSIVMCFIFANFILAGCSKKNELSSADIENYRNYFEKFHVEEAVHITSNESFELEEWKKRYFLLMIDFMTGGFCTSQNLCYLDREYPQQFYEYSIEDIDGDEVPEFLLSYKYNGIEQNRWDIYSAYGGLANSYIGTVMYYNRDRGVLFDGYEGCFLQAYEIVNDRLKNTFSYYIDDGDGEDFINQYYYEDKSGLKRVLPEDEFKDDISDYFYGNISFTGKELCIKNLISDLSIGECHDSISYLESMQAYYGILKYYSRDNSEILDYKFAFVTMDEDEIPEMIAVNDSEIKVFFYENGRLSILSGDSNSDGGSGEVCIFPKKNLFMNFNIKNGVLNQDFYSIRNKQIQKILAIDKEPILSVLGNDYKKDIFGKVQYNNYIDDMIVSENDCDIIRKALYDVLDLDNGVCISDLELKSFDETFDELRSYQFK